MPHYKVTVQLYRTFTFEVATAEEAKKRATEEIKQSGETIFNINEPKDLDQAKQRKEAYLKKGKEIKK